MLELKEWHESLNRQAYIRAQRSECAKKGNINVNEKQNGNGGGNNKSQSSNKK